MRIHPYTSTILPAGELFNSAATLWPADLHFRTTTDPLRWSPVIHLNQVGYLPGLSKKAMVGYYLGSLGELDLGGFQSRARELPLFKLIEAGTGKEAYQGRLVARARARHSSFDE